MRHLLILFSFCICSYSLLAQCTADFSYSQNGYTIVFNDLSSVSPSFSTNYSVSWQWDFGDGNTSTLQNPSHVYSSGVFVPCLTVTYFDSITINYCIDIFCDTILFGNYYGCTDSLALNYDSLATIDDGACLYCDLTTSFTNVYPSDSITCDGVSIVAANSSFPIFSYSWEDQFGNIVSTNDYGLNLCNDIYFVTVVDSSGCSSLDTLLFGSIYGCTDSLALNYFWGATVDDGSCIATIYGCTDPSALNYDSTANTDDGSCCLINQFIGQIGQDIEGELANDLFGWSVSLSSDGNTVAIGAPVNDGNGSGSGHVRIYENIGGSWSQIGQDIDGEAPDDRSGYSLSLSSDGSIVAIGAVLNDDNGTQTGHVRIYENIGGTWTQIGQDIDGTNSWGQSGCSVSLSSDGSTVAIGAWLAPVGGVGSNCGYVRIFSNIGGVWTQIGQDIEGEGGNDRNGWSVSLSSDGTVVAIGAPKNNGIGMPGTVSGHVRIFENIGGVWTQIGQDIDGEAADDLSGWSVSLSSDGSIVAIGAPFNDGNGSDAGHVRIFENIGGTWFQIGQDIDGEGAGDFSGHSISLSSDGNTVAIGAIDYVIQSMNQYYIGSGIGPGRVRIYDFLGGYWYQRGQDIDGEASGDEFGWSVSLSSDGGIVAVGARKNDGNGTESGHVRVYNVNNDTSTCAGCTDILALNYDSIAQYDDSTCVYPYGCIDSLAYNYDSIAINDDGSCLYCDLTNMFVINNNSHGNCDGFIIANSSSSNTPITYLWSNGATGTNIIGLCAGVYWVLITDSVGCTLQDTVYMRVGCTDSLALNFDSTATIDDGSCICNSPKPTGLYSFDVIDTRAKIGWDNMNDSLCMVLKYFVRYREVGTNLWTTKSAGVGNGLCNFGLNTVTKQLLNLSPSTTYEFKMKAFYCGGTSSNYSTPVQFTTADPCPDMTNLAATTFNSNQAKVRFNWDTTEAYTFARILLRVDVPGSNWQTAGGFGVYYPILFVNKFGLTPGESYRAQGRTFCDSNITAYRSPTWTSPIFWTQPNIRLSGGSLISNLDVYPNPSKDIFNISFNSDEVQDLTIRILNVIGAEVYREDKEQFVGEYTKQINLDNYGKGIYFLEIETNTGIVNKKLILQ